MIRRLLVLCVSLACCLALSACKGGDSDSKTVDGLPAYVTSNDEKGAQNFARYWITTLNQATTSGKTAKLKSLNKATCDTCTDFAKQLDEIYGAGGHVETDGFKVKKIANEAGVPKPGAGVSVVLTATPQMLPISGTFASPYGTPSTKLEPSRLAAPVSRRPART